MQCSPIYFRNFIFGVEDSLVSTVGLLSGIAVADVSPEQIFLTGLILIFVEAFSMSAGSFLSEYSAEEYVSTGEVSPRRPFVADGIMFLSYFVSGFIPLFPYILFPVDLALKISIGFSIASLFLLGLVGGKLSKSSLFKSGIRMLLVGGIATSVGVIVGRLIG